MNNVKLLFVVLASTILAACAMPVDGDDEGSLSPLAGTSPIGTVVAPPPTDIACTDASASIESDTDINTGAVHLGVLSTASTWLAWKYAPELSHTIGKVCLASKSLSSTAHVYLLADAGGTPGAVLKGGDLYNGTTGYACTLDAPFDFTAGVVGGHMYWIASNVPAPIVASDGAAIPYFQASADPGYYAPTWARGCSAGFVAKMPVKR